MVNENGYDIVSTSDKIILESVDSIAKKENFITYAYKKRTKSTDGTGFTSKQHEVDIEGETKEGSKKIHLFVKTLLHVETCGNFLSLGKCFETERFFYIEIAELYNKLQNDAKVPVENRINLLKGYEESNSNITVLENADTKGYAIRETHSLVPLEFVEISIKQIAKLHGLGYVLQKKMPEYYKEKVYPLSDTAFGSEIWEKIAANMARCAIKKIQPDLKAKAEAFIPIYVKELPKLLHDKTSVHTLCHGDFRPNNILIKLLNEKPIDAIMIDFQYIYCGCPANDLFFYIYANTDRDFRKKYMDRIIDLYYNSMREFVGYFNIDINEVCPRNEFDASAKEHQAIGLMFCMYFFVPFFPSKTNVPSLAHDLTTQEYEFDDHIYRRFEGIVEDFVDLGVL